MKLATVETMRKLDGMATRDYGIPSIVLMENAGRGTVDLICLKFGDLRGRIVTIFAGPGNNGGDGLVIARHLHQIGAVVKVFLLVPPERLTGDAAANLNIVLKLPISFSLLLADEDFKKVRVVADQSDVLVDALFGSGLKREISGNFAKVVDVINESGRPVVAVDIPSGLDGDTGRPFAKCVRAMITATYGLAQPGHVVYPGVEFIGELHVIDIGIPAKAVEEEQITTELLQRDLVGKLIPLRGPDAHKGSFGHVLIIAGSQGKTGAAILAGHGALRSGSGLVTMCVPGELNHILETSLLEAMTVPMGSAWFFSLADYAAVQSVAVGKNAILVGPGIGTEDETAQLIKKVYQEIDLPMVVDADGLNVLAHDFSEMSKPSAVRILTPHPGEMARLMNCSVKEVQAERLGAASSFAVENGVIVVLKGAATVVAGPNGAIAINPTGNSAMATGGMGDVLSGIIVSLLGQGLSPWRAACLGVYVHGLAADRLAINNKVCFGILASEVARELPLAFHELAGT